MFHRRLNSDYTSQSSNIVSNFLSKRTLQSLARNSLPMAEMTSNDDRVLNEDFVRSLIQDFIHSRVFRVVDRVKYSSNEEDESKIQFIFRF